MQSLPLHSFFPRGCKAAWLRLFAALLTAGTLLAMSPGLMAQSFTVDFSQWTSSPLVKDKFGVYQTPLKTQQSIERASRFLSQAEAQDIRYEMGIGKPGALAYGQVSGTAGDLRYDFSSIDGLTRSWKRAGAHPLFAFTYDPLPLQPDAAPDAWKDVPTSLPAWGEINAAYSSHLLKRDHEHGVFYEQWNEPDLPDGSRGKVFFNGTQTDYGNIFQYGLSGIRQGDSDALVGGPAAAYDLSYLDPIWPQHPDFVSIHAYANYAVQLDNLRGHNGDVVFSPATPMFLTEYNSYTTFGKDQPVSLHQAVAAFFNDVNGLLNISDAAKVYWAQWVDDSLGMLTDDLHPKAIYNAYKIYQTMLPVDRSPVTPPSANGVGVMAGADDHNAGIVLYNTGTTDQTVTVNLTNLPFSGGQGKLYLIDKDHASYLDGAPENLAASGRFQFSGNSTVQAVTVRAQSVSFLKLSDGDGRSLLGEVRLGDYVRSYYWFFNRIFTFHDDAYDDFDPRTSIARLGMATTTSNSNFGVVFHANVYDHPVHKFEVLVKKQGPFSRNDNNSIFGLRIDYQSTNGSYTRSVLFHNGLYDPTRTSALPWGEGTAVPDEAILESGMNTGQPFTVDVDALAPPDWNHRRIILSPIMQNAGYGSYARMILRPVSARCIHFDGAKAEECSPGRSAWQRGDGSGPDVSAVADPLPASFYEKGRSGEFSYSISGLAPGEAYNIRLHFAETHFQNPGERSFDVLLNGKRVLQGFDIVGHAGRAGTAVVVQRTATADSDGVIRLELRRGEAGVPLIDGLEVY